MGTAGRQAGSRFGLRPAVAARPRSRRRQRRRHRRAGPAHRWRQRQREHRRGGPRRRRHRRRRLPRRGRHRAVRRRTRAYRARCGLRHPRRQGHSAQRSGARGGQHGGSRRGGFPRRRAGRRVVAVRRVAGRRPRRRRCPGPAAGSRRRASWQDGVRRRLHRPVAQAGAARGAAAARPWRAGGATGRLPRRAARRDGHRRLRLDERHRRRAPAGPRDAAAAQQAAQHRQGAGRGRVRGCESRDLPAAGDPRPGGGSRPGPRAADHRRPNHPGGQRRHGLQPGLRGGGRGGTEGRRPDLPHRRRAQRGQVPQRAP